MADEWFRTYDWDNEAQAGFERRLRRARPDNRIQYLKIKGLSLHEVGLVDDARALWTRVLELPDRFGIHHVAATENLARSWAKDDPHLAIKLYREIVNRHPRANGASSILEVALAELLLDGGSENEVKEASNLLDYWDCADTLFFPRDRFRYELARVRVAQARADNTAARAAATEALRLAELGPQFPRHGPIGVVETDATTLDQLRRIISNA